MYFTDMNGDGFPDVINPNGVKYISNYQKPHLYSLPDCLPPVITIDSVPLIVACDTLPPIEPYVDTNLIDAVQYDFVRVWVADLPDHEDLYYRLGGKIYFADMEDRKMEYFAGEEDSLVLSIQWHKRRDNIWIDTLLWIDTMGRLDMINMGSKCWDNNQISQTMSAAGTTGNSLKMSDHSNFQSFPSTMMMINPGSGNQDSTEVVPIITTLTDTTKNDIPTNGFGTTLFNNLRIKQGDTLYFRVHALRNGVNIPLVWNPSIQPNIAFLNGCEEENNENGRLFVGGSSAAESQLLQGDSNFYCPFDGKITISYNYKNLEALLDTVYYEIRHNTIKKNHFKIPPGDYYYVNYTVSEFEVHAGDSLSFKVLCGSNVNYTQAQWNPKITYQEAEYDSIPFISHAESDTIEYEIAPYYQYYHKILYLDYDNFVYSRSTTSTIPIDSLKVSRTITSPSNTLIPVRFTITQPGNGNKHLFAETVSIDYSEGLHSIANNTYITLEANKPFYVSCFVPRAWAWCIGNCYITIDGVDYKCAVYTQEKNNNLWGGMYGRWGEFQYLSDDLKLMNRSKIFMSAAYRMGFGSQYAIAYADTCSIADSIDELVSMINKGADDDYINNYKRLMSALPMFNEIQLTNGTGTREHRGYYPNSFINKSYIYLGGIPAYDLIEEDDEKDCSGNSYAASGSSNGTGNNNNSPGGNNNKGGNTPNTVRISGYSKHSSSKTLSYSFGVSIPGLGLGRSRNITYSKQISDLMDLNGDGFPDIIQAGTVRYSEPFVGKWGSKKNVFDEGCHQKTTSTSVTKSYTADPQGLIRRAKNNGKGETAHTKAGKSSDNYSPDISATAAYSTTYTEDITHFTLIDVNGDGLPDRVYHASPNTGNIGKNVALNIGYKFEAPEYWDLNLNGNYSGLSTGYSISNAKAASINGGFSKSGANHSFSLGMSLSTSFSQHKEMFIDMNGDGIPDRIVFTAENQITIYFNLGCGFLANNKAMIITFALLNSPNFCETSVTNSLSGTVSLTLGFPIVWWAKISGSVGADASFSISSENLSFVDMNGDGYTDIVIAPSPDKMVVFHSQLGKMGLLKKVTNPLGGTIEMDYTLTNVSVLHSRRQVLSEVKIKSNHENDTNEMMLTKYNYESGYYDRKERNFYGFAKVTEKQYDTRNNNAVLRSTVKYYHNTNPYNKGLNMGEVLAEGDIDVNEKIFIRTHNKWTMRNPVGNMVAFTPTTQRAYPALDTTVTCYFEGQSVAQIRKEETYQYDTYGRVTKQTSTSTDMPFIEVDISYNHPLPGNYNINVPSEVIVKNSGQNYRKRTTG
ncbi:MAG: hypothetical protein LBT43_04030, partial [Prevotella sp.]|nr:hypothetical protein [Prevotella sp.]